MQEKALLYSSIEAGAGVPWPFSFPKNDRSSPEFRGLFLFQKMITPSEIAAVISSLLVAKKVKEKLFISNQEFRLWYIYLGSKPRVLIFLLFYVCYERFCR